MGVGCGSKTGIPKWVALVSGNMDQNLRNPSSLILSHCHLAWVKTNGIPGEHQQIGGKCMFMMHRIQRIHIGFRCMPLNLEGAQQGMGNGMTPINHPPWFPLFRNFNMVQSNSFPIAPASNAQHRKRKHKATAPPRDPALWPAEPRPHVEGLRACAFCRYPSGVAKPNRKPPFGNSKSFPSLTHTLHKV